jgi:hypothetical protein
MGQFDRRARQQLARVDKWLQKRFDDADIDGAGRADRDSWRRSPRRAPSAG